MFKDYDGKVISISRKVESKNISNLEVQTNDDEIDFYNEEVQNPEREEKTVQTEYKEILSSDNLKINEKNLQTFLVNVYYSIFILPIRLFL
jgi:hypothetical protein